MTGVTSGGLRWAQSGDVRVLLYSGSDGGVVQILRHGEWGLVRPGDVCYNLIIALAVEATTASSMVETDEFLAQLANDPN